MRRRPLGWIFIAYGLAGLALVAVGAVVGLDLADRVERLTLAADDTLQAASASTVAAADAFDSLDASLDQGRASADGAAVLAQDASATLSSLSETMRLSVFGTQPLLPLADDFETSADQAARLGAALQGVRDSLEDTRGDLAGIGLELRGLADELVELQDAAVDPDGSSPPLRLFVVLLLAWLAIPAVGSLIVGGALLRPVAAG
ncbi:MAG: hypothetical protein ACRDGV_10030 [Candidatus Limnocylindria bacterium]